MEQSTNFLPYIIGWFVGMIIGWMIGFFDSNLRSSKKIKKVEESAQVTIQEAKDKIAQAESKMASIAATPVTVDDPGLLRIKSENGALTLDLDGARVNPIALYPDQRKRLIEMLNVMRPWLEHKPVSMPATPPPPPPQPTPSPANYTAPPSQPIPPRPTPVQTPTPAPAPKKEDAPTAAPTTMVGQINAILQTRIAKTKLADIGVTMIESPSGGVFVYIGLNKFEGIEAVPDEEVKAAIRAAIAEWERKYTPGLG
jgi:hypothetical protein